MFRELMLPLHAAFGELGTLLAVWIAAELVRVDAASLPRIRHLSCLCATLMWMAAFVGGFWYLSYYPADKAAVIAGPWPWAHTVIMETKEHIFFLLLLVANFMPIAVRWSDPVGNAKHRRLAIATAVTIAVLGLSMVELGNLVNMGFRMAFRAT